MWASSKRIARDENGLLHLYRVGDRRRTVCGEYPMREEGWEMPTCVACIAYWTHPCSDICAMFDGCADCDGKDARL